MLRFVLILSLCAAVTGLSLAAEADSKGTKKETPKKDDSYIKVEAKGQLLTGIRSSGGETTGMMIRTSAGAFELEVEKKVETEAKKLNDKTVIVTGIIYTKLGMKNAARTLIKVDTLKEAK